MSYAIGIKALRRLCFEQNPLAWQRAKLSSLLFKPYEMAMYDWVAGHMAEFHALPQLDTLQATFPDVAAVDTPEPSNYYVAKLESRYFYDVISKANLDSQSILKEDQDASDKALETLRAASNAVVLQKYRLQILDVGKEAATLVLGAYHNLNPTVNLGVFGWPYLDHQTKGVQPGEVVSFCGRPAIGKTWLTLWTALKNWVKGENVLFVSMEMLTLPVAQRIVSLYTHTGIGQLKDSAFASPTYDKFKNSLKGMVIEKSKFYVIDGNLAASVEDIFDLADILGCFVVVIDGGYLVRHRNHRLDRYTRAAENVELMKRRTSDDHKITFASWQFSRKASEKQKKAKGKGMDEDTGLEDIGYSDAIGQISSIVLGMFEDDNVETIKKRLIRVLKGRNGEIGEFSIAWNFLNMSFDQVDPPLVIATPMAIQELQWI